MAGNAPAARVGRQMNDRTTRLDLHVVRRDSAAASAWPNSVAFWVSRTLGYRQQSTYWARAVLDLAEDRDWANRGTTNWSSWPQMASAIRATGSMHQG